MLTKLFSSILPSRQASEQSLSSLNTHSVVSSYSHHPLFREIYDLQVASKACGFCTTPLNLTSPLLISCPNSPCSLRFCNRLCSARSSKTHPLLCPSSNPASVPLLKFARDAQWMALAALIHVTSRIMLVNQHDEEALRFDWDVVQGLAVLGMEDRLKWGFAGWVHTSLCSSDVAKESLKLDCGTVEEARPSRTVLHGRRRTHYSCRPSRSLRHHRSRRSWQRCSRSLYQRRSNTPFLTTRMDS